MLGFPVEEMLTSMTTNAELGYHPGERQVARQVEGGYHRLVEQPCQSLSFNLHNVIAILPSGCIPLLWVWQTREGVKDIIEEVDTAFLVANKQLYGLQSELRARATDEWACVDGPPENRLA